MNTRKHPRTLNEAFGTYTSRDFYEPPASYPWSWWALMAAIGVVTVAVIVASA